MYSLCLNSEELIDICNSSFNIIEIYTMNTENMWDKRYREEGFAYGTQPNDFLSENMHHLPVGGEILCLAEGEGRNGVFLARHGFQVTAVDSSAVGLKKAEALARQHDVTILTKVADLKHFPLEDNSYDGVISIFCHLPPEVRNSLHRKIINGLKPGGILILEAYTPDQLKYGTGGPPHEELMMNLQMLTEDFQSLCILHGVELLREIHEGCLHTGHGAVVQFIAQKK
jgi:SAM-dependent methyltransferase